jgi:hypothetical protein
MPPAIHTEQFNIAYRVGAIFLAESRPNGAGSPQAAIALLTKGFRASPRRWQYFHDIGFVYYWWLRDYPSAAHWFERASAVPGAPEWLRPLAAVTLTRGGERGAARALWQQVLDTSEPAASWAPLVRREWIPRDPPTDPAGIPYVLDRDTGVATVSERSPYHPLPDVTTPGARPPS